MPIRPSRKAAARATKKLRPNTPPVASTSRVQLPPAPKPISIGSSPPPALSSQRRKLEQQLTWVQRLYERHQKEVWYWEEQSQVAAGFSRHSADMVVLTAEQIQHLRAQLRELDNEDNGDSE